MTFSPLLDTTFSLKVILDLVCILFVKKAFIFFQKVLLSVMHWVFNLKFIKVLLFFPYQSYTDVTFLVIWLPVVSFLVFRNLFLRQLLPIIYLFLFIKGASFALTYRLFRGTYFSRVLSIVLLKESKLKISSKIVNENFITKILVIVISNNIWRLLFIENLDNEISCKSDNYVSMVIESLKHAALFVINAGWISWVFKAGIFLMFLQL